MASNKRSLKAYVRYDGTGRVVPSSLILQRFKPKDGNWQEIDGYECCNYVPTPGTTTTTTTVSSTQFIQGYWLNSEDACTTTTAGNLTVYSASPTLTAGVSVFTDNTLTTPATEGYVIFVGMTRFLIGTGGVLSTLIC